MLVKRQISRSNGTSEGASNSNSQSNSRSQSGSQTENYSEGTTRSESNTTSRSHTTTQTQTTGKTHGATFGFTEQTNKQAVLAPADIITETAVIADPTDAAFPGQCLVILRGGRQALVRTVIYYEDEFFYGKFGPHPRYGFKQAPLPYDMRMEAKRQKLITQETQQQKNVAEILELAIASHQRTVERSKNIEFNFSLSFEDVQNLSSTYPDTLSADFKPLRYKEVSEKGKLVKHLKPLSPLVTFSNGIPLLRVPVSPDKYPEFEIIKRHKTDTHFVVQCRISVAPPDAPKWIADLQEFGEQSEFLELMPEPEQWAEYLQSIEEEQREAIKKEFRVWQKTGRQPFTRLARDIDAFNNQTRLTWLHALHKASTHSRLEAFFATSLISFAVTVISFIASAITFYMSRSSPVGSNHYDNMDLLSNWVGGGGCVVGTIFLASTGILVWAAQDILNEDHRHPMDDVFTYQFRG